jgi:predicted amino acid racemase
LKKNGFEIKQINAPGTTSTRTLERLAQKGATHVEPGHGMTGTTPAHAFYDFPEIPAVLYVSEISHIYGKYAYFYGGGLYVDPVFSPYPIKALMGRDSDGILKGRYETKLPDPSSIDYYGMLIPGSEKVSVGDTVILGFRPQIFHSRGQVSVIKRVKTGKVEVLGLWNSIGQKVE